MNDDFLHDYRREPPAEAMDSLWERLAQKEPDQPMRIQPTDEQRTRINWLRWGWAAAAVALIAASLALPPVRALAQEIIDLFRRAETDTVIVSPEEGEALAARWTRYESLADLEAATGTVRLLPVQVLPASYALENTALRSDGMIYLGYRPLDVQGLLSFTQQPVTNFATDDHPTGQIGPDATVESFEVSGVEVQYVTGGWQGDSESSGVLTWTSDPTTRMLRWEQDGIVYTLWAGGNPTEPYAIDRDAMLAAAQAMIDGVEAVQPDVAESGVIETEGVTWEPATYPQAESYQITWTYEAPTMPAGFEAGLSIEEAEARAGFAVPVPSYLPDGFALREATYMAELNAVSLVYQWQDAPERIVTLTVQPADRLNDLLAFEAATPPGTISPIADVVLVDVNGAQGEMVRGDWSWDTNEVPEPGQVIMAEWEDSIPYTRLRWQQDGLILTLRNGGDGVSQLDVATLLTIARSVE